jgi:hypothetical protein
VKVHVVTSLALFSIVLCPGRAQNFETPVLGGPFVYGAIYIDVGGIDTAFDLTYVTDIDAPNGFGIAQYSESFALWSEFVWLDASIQASNLFDALPDCNYLIAPVGSTSWETPGCPELTYLGSSGPITWTDNGEMLTQLDIDLGMGQGINFSYSTPNGLNWVGNGTMTIAGLPWLVSGAVDFTAIETGIGRLEFVPVPEPATVGALGGAVALLLLRRKPQ